MATVRSCGLASRQQTWLSVTNLSDCFSSCCPLCSFLVYSTSTNKLLRLCGVLMYEYYFIWQRSLSHCLTRVSYVDCPENICPLWISREPVAWPRCNLVASQWTPYCASANSHSPVGLVSRQWDAVDWTIVLCDRHIHNDRASGSASSR